MTTVINNPGTGTNDDGSGFLLGLLVLIVVVGAFIIWGVPALRDSSSVDRTTNINVEVPTPDLDNGQR